MSSPWLLCHERRESVRARLFCFPYAGAGASTYRLWSRELPAGVEVIAIQPPGRENRLREAGLTSIGAMVEALVPELLPKLDVPYALFGHSMGAIVAFETARALEGRGEALAPKHVFLSGRRAAQLAVRESPIHQLSDASFLEQVQQRYGAIPESLLREAELMALLLPCLRADFAALESFHPGLRGPLACAISVFGGSDDSLAPLDELEAWRSQTTGAFRVRQFEGGHFYLTPRRAELLADLATTLAPLCESTSLRGRIS